MKRNTFNPSEFFGNDSVVRRFQKKYADRFSPGQRVLDLGSGRGIFLELLRERNVAGIGVDTFGPSLQHCRHRGLTVVKSDVLRFVETTKEKYDGVFCSHVIEHLEPPDAVRLIEGIESVLGLEGTAIVITPNMRDIEVLTERFWLDVSHVRPYPLPLIRSMFEYVGLTVVESGLDKDTGQRFLKRSPFKIFRHALMKLRWGEYFGNGDTFVIAQKKAAQPGSRD